MKTFDYKFKAQKKYSKNDFKQLRKLYKKKFIQRRLKKEGNPLKFVMQQNITFDIGSTDFMYKASGFEDLKINRQDVLSADIDSLLRNIKDEDINEVVGPEEIVKDSEDDDEVFNRNSRSTKIEQKSNYGGVEPFEKISIDQDEPFSRNLNSASLYTSISFTLFLLFSALVQ